jgi:hypothetical protein
VGVAVPDSSGMACVYAGGGGTPGAMKFEFDIIRELRAWTCFKIRIWIDNWRHKKHISKLLLFGQKGRRRTLKAETLSLKLASHPENGRSVCF